MTLQGDGPAVAAAAERLPRKLARSLFNRAIALLARRDHSRAELARKLARYVEDSDAAELNRVLDKLDRHGLLSDERFALSVVRTRSQRFGDARIRHDLRRFGVSNEAQAAALGTLAGSEVQRAFEVWSRRFKTLPLSAAERGRHARFLQSRGFSCESISSVLRGRRIGDEG